ncbi:MAG: hypothetical protein P8Y34_06450, partial [Anaerolineales bacterium]
VERELGVASQSPLTFQDLSLPLPRIQSDSVILPSEILDRVMYWEVDPNWDGKLFHSREQAARPWRKGDLRSSLPLPRNHAKICIRVVLISGEVIQQPMS